MFKNKEKNKLLKLSVNYIVVAGAFQFCFLVFFLLLAFEKKIQGSTFYTAFFATLLLPIIVFIVITYKAYKTKKSENEEAYNKIIRIYKGFTLFFGLNIVGIILLCILNSCVLKLKQYNIVKSCPYLITTTSCGMFDCTDHSYCIYSNGTVLETTIPVVSFDSEYTIMDAKASGYESIITFPKGEFFTEFISGKDNYVVTKLEENSTLYSALYKYNDYGNLELITNKIPGWGDYTAKFFVQE